MALRREYHGRERDEKLRPAGRKRQRNRSFHGQSAPPGGLKAANRGYTDIKLRERGTKKLHVFTGDRVQVDKPKGGPAWMPDKIWKPQVKKVGTEKLE
jgi:hypothetical protein